MIQFDILCIHFNKYKILLFAFIGLLFEIYAIARPGMEVSNVWDDMAALPFRRTVAYCYHY